MNLRGFAFVLCCSAFACSGPSEAASIAGLDAMHETVTCADAFIATGTEQLGYRAVRIELLPKCIPKGGVSSGSDGKTLSGSFSAPDPPAVTR